MNRAYLLGWVFAGITAFIWAVYSNVLKIGSLYFTTIHPTVFILQSLIVASLILLIISGPGRLSASTLRNTATWVYGTAQILNNVFVMAAFTFAMTATSVSLLSRMGIAISALFALFAGINEVKSKWGFSLICVGMIVVAFGAEATNKPVAIFLLFLACVFQVIQTKVSSQHKESNMASGDLKAELRVTGYVLSITSVTYVVFLLLANYVNLDALLPQLLPTKEEIISKESLLLALFTGTFVIATMKYFEFYATKTIGSTNFLVVVAISPLLTIFVEYLVDFMGILSARDIGAYDAIGCFLIITGALLKVIKELKIAKQRKKIAPEVQKNNDLIKDTINSTLSCFADNMEQTSQALGISILEIKEILNDEREVSNELRNKILVNHASNIVGLDPLTGLQNQTSFDLKLAKLPELEKAIILFIDLNKFKPVNDTYGHKAGDAILKGVALRLEEIMPFPHTVSRLGGDEYGAIIYGEDANKIDYYVEQIRKSVEQPFIVEDIEDEILISCSIGSAHYPTEGEDGQKLKHISDERMYEDKKGRSER